ncbi:hypothetical protein [Lysinibacillus sp. SGAir0095]|uniref:hypothetical protein n=1 Tax=Lysinibacillus sp. SGAir0095 TaxID=2070463 RepID=UPI0010CCD099|nr:hypothetical protein [Lysinibacillus sp. SGAir0095]QCR32289.1 hypothetical protein C1N55_08930 [Lysinibacillus sp. SGAir0095]
MYENNYPELKKEDRYTSPASSKPLHELKMLQEYIHSVNLQNLGTLLPHYKQQMILLKFFKSKKNQLVEIYSRNKDEVIHTVGKVSVVGRDFVMIRTLLTRIWIPYRVIHSAKTPFGLPDMPGTHQNVLIDEELRRKLLTNFAVTVAEKQSLRQQFFEELLLTNLQSWVGTKITIYNGSNFTAKLRGVSKEKLLFKEKEIAFSKITYMKQARVLSFFEKIFKKLKIKKSNN